MVAWKRVMAKQVGLLWEGLVPEVPKAELHKAERRLGAYLLVGLKMKKELASGIGTAFSFSCSSARGRGRGLRGISGSSSSSSPAGGSQGGKRKGSPRDGGAM